MHLQMYTYETDIQAVGHVLELVDEPEAFARFA